MTAGGGGNFDKPQYEARLTIRDFFAADEGIGRVFGILSVEGDLLTIKMEAASPRLAVSGGGRIAMTDAMDAELSFSVSDTSLDPYIRAFQPDLSPYTTAVASGGRGGSVSAGGDCAGAGRASVRGDGIGGGRRKKCLPPAFPVKRKMLRGLVVASMPSHCCSISMESIVDNLPARQ